MLKEDEKFDLKIRSILEDGREEVPDHIWDAVCRKLDSEAAPQIQQRKRPAVVWLRNTGIGIAAAAAVTLAIVFSGTSDSLRNPASNTGEKVLAVAQPQENDSTDIVSRALIAEAGPEELSEKNTIVNTIPDAVPDIRDIQSSPSPETVAQESPANTETALANSGTDTVNAVQDTAGASGETPAKKASTATSGQKESEGTDDKWEDYFNDFTEEEASPRRGKVKTSITILGNAASNSNSERASRSMMLAPGTISGTGVRETGEEGSRYGIPVSFGAGVRLSFSPKWSMSVGLNYTYLTRTFEGIYVNAETPGKISHYDDIRNSQNYIGIPVNFYYSIVRKDFIDFYAYAGGAVDYCLTNSYTASNAEGSLYHKGETGSLQFSADIGIGVEFIVTDYLGIYIDPSLRYYFRNSNAPKSIRTAQPLMLGFEAGLRFRL